MLAFTASAEEFTLISEKNTDLRPSQIMGLAQDYSIEHPDTIGVFLNIAPDTKYTDVQIAKLIKVVFKDEGIETFITSFTSPGAVNGVSNITFFLKGISFSNFTFDRLEQGIINMANTHKAERRQKEIEDSFRR
ncbi:MAG: hypothetical protein O7D86_13125 [Proteobacteria bacterium]|nr:hypothetical protein [Pseudomonadota bacterium]